MKHGHYRPITHKEAERAAQVMFATADTLAESASPETAAALHAVSMAGRAAIRSQRGSGYDPNTHTVRGRIGEVR